MPVPYGLEPYAVAGDVYTASPYVGRGGWSWYTGAAAWLHRGAIESIFGLEQGAEALRLSPCLPSHWPGAELSLSRDGHRLRFVLVRGDAQAAQAMAAHAGAQRLLPGQWLPWRPLTADRVYLMALPG